MDGSTRQSHKRKAGLWPTPRGGHLHLFLSLLSSASFRSLSGSSSITSSLPQARPCSSRFWSPPPPVFPRGFPDDTCIAASDAELSALSLSAGGKRSSQACVEDGQPESRHQSLEDTRLLTRSTCLSGLSRRMNTHSLGACTHPATPAGLM